jgi:hypothetical protein
MLDLIVAMTLQELQEIISIVMSISGFLVALYAAGLLAAFFALF